MFEISVKSHFCAAHHLPGYKGSCVNVHGHNWEIEVYVRGTQLDETGILIDFRELRRTIAEELEALDHTDLNAAPAFADTPPTSENIARYLCKTLAARVDDSKRRIHRVTVWETNGAAATYVH